MPIIFYKIFTNFYITVVNCLSELLNIVLLATICTVEKLYVVSSSMCFWEVVRKRWDPLMTKEVRSWCGVPPVACSVIVPLGMNNAHSPRFTWPRFTWMVSTIFYCTGSKAPWHWSNRKHWSRLPSNLPRSKPLTTGLSVAETTSSIMPALLKFLSRLESKTAGVNPNSWLQEGHQQQHLYLIRWRQVRCKTNSLLEFITSLKQRKANNAIVANHQAQLSSTWQISDSFNVIWCIASPLPSLFLPNLLPCHPILISPTLPPSSPSLQLLIGNSKFTVSSLQGAWYKTAWTAVLYSSVIYSFTKIFPVTSLVL